MKEEKGKDKEEERELGREEEMGKRQGSPLILEGKREECGR